MKQILAILTLIASLTFTSCEDFLTEEVRGQQNLDTYFQSVEEAESFITGCYQAITFGGWWNINTVWLLSEMCSDDGWMGNTTQSQSDYISLAHYQGTGQSNGAISNFWQYRYKGILRCNVAVERISQSEFSDEDMKNRLIGEARFLRGYFYFELVRNFGGVPLVTSFLLPEEIQGITRASAEDVYKFIEDDLKAAADALPKRSEYAATDMGRATSGAALGLLGKVYLYQEKWQEAHDVLETVIDSKEYELLDNFGDVWSVDHNNSKESLFEVQYMYDGTYSLGGSLTIITVVVPATDGLGVSLLPTSNRLTLTQVIPNAFAGLSSKPDVPRLPVKITSISSLKIAKTWLITRLISRSMVGIRIAI